MSLVQSNAQVPLQNVSTKVATATNAAAAVTYAATAGVRWILHYLLWSYTGSPVGSITITDGTTTIVLDITVGGPGYVGFEFVGVVGAAVTVTLAAGGSGVVGRVATVAVQSSN